MRSIALATLAFLSAAGALAQEKLIRELPPAIGPYTNLKPDDFRLSQNFKSDGKVVMTHDFYWYDDRTKPHLKERATSISRLMTASSGPARWT